MDRQIISNSAAESFPTGKINGLKNNKILAILDSQCDLLMTVLEINAALGRKSSIPARKNAALMVLLMLSALANHQ